jgi:hypothetical protein
MCARLSWALLDKAFPIKIDLYLWVTFFRSAQQIKSTAPESEFEFPKVFNWC